MEAASDISAGVTASIRRVSPIHQCPQINLQSLVGITPPNPRLNTPMIVEKRGARSAAARIATSS